MVRCRFFVSHFGTVILRGLSDNSVPNSMYVCTAQMQKVAFLIKWSLQNFMCLEDAVQLSTRTTNS
jgi:hypothetical protein